MYTNLWINTFIKFYLNEVLPVLFVLKSVKCSEKGKTLSWKMFVSVTGHILRKLAGI